MDGIVGWTHQTYNSLPPCQEIDISCYKLSQNDDFVSKQVNIRVRSPPSWNPVFGTTWLRFFSRPRFRSRARNPVGPRPVYSMYVYSGKVHGVFRNSLFKFTTHATVYHSCPHYELPMEKKVPWNGAVSMRSRAGSWETLSICIALRHNQGAPADMHANALGILIISRFPLA